jgi:hypothetical protein
VYTNRNLFRQTGLQKGGKVNNCSLDYGRLVRRIFEETLTSPNPDQNSTTQWRIFSSKKIKVRQPIGRKNSIQTVIRTSMRLDLFLYEGAQKFEVFSNIQK